MILLINISIFCFIFKSTPAEYLINYIMDIVSQIFVNRISPKNIRNNFKNISAENYKKIKDIEPQVKLPGSYTKDCSQGSENTYQWYSSSNYSVINMEFGNIMISKCVK